MTTHRLAARLTAFATAVAIALPAHAQPAPADPPARVGRLASITGTVSYHLANADRWEAATLNLPLTTGAAVWTEPSSRAGIGVGGNQITLDASTEFDLDQLDDHVLVATQPQGATYLHLRIVPTADSYTVATPRGIVGIAAVGRYEVVAGDLEHPTTVTVIDGAAQVTGLPTPVTVAANQTLTITGDGTMAPLTPSLGPAVRDPFLTAMLAAERPAGRRPNVPAYVEQMTGIDALYDTGEWAEVPEYGEVWYPPAEQGFVPYRNGHWAYVAPWGWTWVDNAPWGFAPTHYGRWAEVNGRWGWLPGRPAVPEERPVYAPAVVGFLAGAAAGSLVSWVPLGPHEAYHPPYRTSERYVQALNRAYVPDPRALRAAPGQLANRAAATGVPPQVLAQSQNVMQAAQPVPQVGQRPAPIQFRPPVTPTAATVGVTRGLAQQLRLPLFPLPHPAAPGPSLAPSGARPQGGPGSAQRPPAAPGPALSPAAGAAAGAAAGIAAGGLFRPAPPTGAASPGGIPQLRPQGAGRLPGQAGAPGPAIPRPGGPGAPALPGLSPAGGQTAPAPGVVAAPPPRPRAATPAAPEPYAPPTPGAIAPGVVPGRPGAAAPAVPQTVPAHEVAPAPGPRPPPAPQPPAAAPPTHQPPAAVTSPHVAAPVPPAPQARPVAPAAPQARPAPPPQARPIAPPPLPARPVAPPPPQAHPPPPPQPRFIAPPPPPQARPAPPPVQARPAPPPPQARPAPPPPQARPASPQQGGRPHDPREH